MLLRIEQSNMARGAGQHLLEVTRIILPKVHEFLTHPGWPRYVLNALIDTIDPYIAICLARHSVSVQLMGEISAHSNMRNRRFFPYLIGSGLMDNATAPCSWRCAPGFRVHDLSVSVADPGLICAHNAI